MILGRVGVISIHALLAESDADTLTDDVSTGGFLSTLSLRRATVAKRTTDIRPIFLSTLSLRRATLLPTRKTPRNWHFYPRSPCGERRWLRCWQLAARDISIHALLAESDMRVPLNACVHFVFLSTLSLRRATITITITCTALRFLSTLSLRRAT